MEKIQRVRVTSAESGTSTEYGIQAGGQMSVQLVKDNWIQQQDGTYIYKIECLPTLSETDDCIVDFVSTPTKDANDALLDAWSADNPNGKWPRASEGFTSASHPRIRSNFWCPSTSYLRVKNIQLGYNLPEAWVKAIGLNRVRIYYSGENLFTFDNLKLKIDPESPDGNAYIYPPMKTNSFGINITF